MAFRSFATGELLSLTRFYCLHRLVFAIPQSDESARPSRDDGAFQIAAQISVEVFPGNFDERFQAERAGVVHEHVDTVHSDANHRFAGFPVADVASDNSDPIGRPQLLRRSRELALVAAVEGDIDALLEEGTGDVGPKSTSRISVFAWAVRETDGSIVTPTPSP
jgi:hypothetical protein